MPMAQGNHDRHVGHSVAMFRDKFWLSFALTIPVVFWSMDVQRWLGHTAPSFPVRNSSRNTWNGRVRVWRPRFYSRGMGRTCRSQARHDALISLAIVVAFGTSLAATFGPLRDRSLVELASLITIMVLGHWLEMRAISQAEGTQCARPRFSQILPNA